LLDQVRQSRGEHGVGAGAGPCPPQRPALPPLWQQIAQRTDLPATAFVSLNRTIGVQSNGNYPLAGGIDDAAIYASALPGTTRRPQLLRRGERSGAIIGDHHGGRITLPDAGRP
jgi:hypothetical protein